VQGEEHPETLHAMNDLADLYMYQGKFASAESLHSKVLEIRRRLLGDKNSSTLTSMGNLSAAYESKVSTRRLSRFRPAHWR